MLAEVEFQIGSKFKSFPDGESFHEDVLLHDVVGKISKAIVVEWNPIGLDLSTQILGFYSAGKGIEQSGFSCAWGSHDGGQLPSFEDAW